VTRKPTMAAAAAPAARTLRLLIAFVVIECLS
jgi:hypothetical protein